MLEARGVEVPADLAARLDGCADVATLEEWLRRAAVVPRAEQVFAANA